MTDDDDLVRAEKGLADDQRADDVVGGEPAGVPDDVGVAGTKAERFLDVEPRVHAGNDGDATQRRGGQRRAVERLGVTLVLRKDPAELAAVSHRPAVSRPGRTGASTNARARSSTSERRGEPTLTRVRPDGVRARRPGG